jgi:hypothetical protein
MDSDMRQRGCRLAGGGEVCIYRKFRLERTVIHLALSIALTSKYGHHSFRPDTDCGLWRHSSVLERHL